MLKAKRGIAPIAGLTGMETGRRFPMDMDEPGPKANPPVDMAIKGRAELKRVMDAAGYEVDA